ncbi:MAG: hypothetical protein AAFV69_01410 [Pseudomonadota bacterium]
MYTERIENSSNIAPEQTLARLAKITDLKRLIAQSEQRVTVSRPDLLSDQQMSKRLTSCVGEIGQLGQPWNTGIEDIDDVLPIAGMSAGAVHEVSGAAYGDTVAASSYVLSLLWQLARLAPSGPILWCQTTKSQQEFGSVYGAGLKAFGFHASQFIFAETPHKHDVLWALEEGARSRSLLAVVGEVDAISFTQTRRLSLAAAKSGTPVLLLRAHNDLSASATETRWRIATTQGMPDPFLSNAPGNPCWQVELVRCRGGRPGSWNVEWNNETHRFSLVEQFSSRSSEVANTAINKRQIHFPQRRSA